MLRILILCTGNSCRSIMAEALLNHHGAGRIEAVSAGSFPTGHVHPMSLAMLKAHGIPAEDYHSKSWNMFASTKLDAVITVCDNAAGESCPVFPGAPVKAHWGVPDPAHAHGAEAEVEAEFNRVFIRLEKRVMALLQLPLATMSRDELQKKLTQIGRE